MKKILFLCVLLSYCVLSTHAQWYKVPFGKISKPKPRLFTQSLTNQVTRKVVATQPGHSALSSLQALPKPLDQAIFTVQENHRIFRHLRKGTVTSFVIEDSNGKKWGVTTPHAYLLQTAVLDPHTNQRMPISASHTAGLWDIAIFELPEPFASQVTPLRLATHSPAPGETLYSVGFFNNEFHLEANRVVQEVGPNRVITSLDIDRSCSRSGACGGPILNQNGEVVAVHVGSHLHKNIGFAVPVEKIYELLQEAHQQIISQKPLIFNGKQIGTIFRNQFIRSIHIYRDGKQIQSQKTYLRENEVDYAHLEQLVNPTQADKLVFHIVEALLPSQGQKQHFRAFSLTYDFSTEQASITQKGVPHPFYRNFRFYVHTQIAKLLPNQLVVFIRNQRTKYKK